MFAFFETGFPLASDALPTIPPPLFYANVGFRVNIGFDVPTVPFHPAPTAIADTQSVRVVPEPGTVVLVAVGLVALVRRRFMSRREVD